MKKKLYSGLNQHWCVRAPKEYNNGYFYCSSTLSTTRAEAISHWTGCGTGTTENKKEWRALKKKGFAVVKVQITEIQDWS